MYALASHYHHLEDGYDWKHTLINNELVSALFPDAYKMPVVVTMTMAAMMIVIMDFPVPPCSSVKGGSGGNGTFAFLV